MEKPAEHSRATNIYVFIETLNDLMRAHPACSLAVIDLLSKSPDPYTFRDRAPLVHAAIHPDGDDFADWEKSIVMLTGFMVLLTPQVARLTAQLMLVYQEIKRLGLESEFIAAVKASAEQRQAD